MPYMLGFIRKDSQPKLYGNPVYLVDFDNPTTYTPTSFIGFGNKIKNSINMASFNYKVENKTIKKLHYDQDGFPLSTRNKFGNYLSKPAFTSVWINVLDVSSNIIASAGDDEDEFKLIVVNGKLCTYFTYKHTINSTLPYETDGIKNHEISITEGWHHIAFISIEDKYKAFYLDGKRIIFDFSEYNVDSNLMPTDGGTSMISNRFSVGTDSGVSTHQNINIQFSEYYISEITAVDPLMNAAPTTIEVPKSALIIE